MNTENDSIILERKGVRPTANRILILRTMLAADHPVSLPELEDIMETMDKSSIFRVLNVFVKHHVAHEIEDGRNTRFAAAGTNARSTTCTYTSTARCATAHSASRRYTCRE